MTDFKKRLLEIGIDSRNGVVIGSGILQALKIRDSKDIDVVVNDDSYNKLKSSRTFKVEAAFGREILKKDIFEIGTDWFVLGKSRKFDDLKKISSIIEDVRYISVNFLYQVKQSWAKQENVRQKDIDDIKLIENYLIQNNLALTDVIIELHVDDFEKVKDFYGKLGFEKVWEYEPKGTSGYLVIKRDTSILAFYCGNEEVYNQEYFKQFPKATIRGYGVELAIHITNRNLDDYYNELMTKLDKRYLVQELETKPWGTKDFRLIDPFGYYLSIRENDKILIP